MFWFVRNTWHMWKMHEIGYLGKQFKSMNIKFCSAWTKFWEPDSWHPFSLGKKEKGWMLSFTSKIGRRRQIVMKPNFNSWLTLSEWSIQGFRCVYLVCVCISYLNHFWVWVKLIRLLIRKIKFTHILLHCQHWTNTENTSSSFNLQYGLAFGKTEAICWILLKTRLYAPQ